MAPAVVVLSLLGTIGGALAVPYVLGVFPPPPEAPPIPIFFVMFLGGLQAGILTMVFAALGLGCATIAEFKVWGWFGQDAQTRQRWARSGRKYLVWGVIAGFGVAAVDAVVLFPLLPAPVRPIGTPSLWAALGATVYGGVNEEVMMRLFTVSAFAALFTWPARRSGRVREHGPHFLAAIVVAAVLFGAAHLPTALLVWPLTPIVVARVMTLNAVLGIPLGFIFIRKGLELTILTHAAMDIGLHVLGRVVSPSLPSSPV